MELSSFFFIFFFVFLEGHCEYPHAGGFLGILGVLMGAPSASPPLTPTLMSIDVNQSIHAIPYNDFDGILDFMVKKVILAILAILAIFGVEDDPL